MHTSDTINIQEIIHFGSNMVNVEDMHTSDMIHIQAICRFESDKTMNV
jgi:hypothetical protein